MAMGEPLLSYELKSLLDDIKTRIVNEFPINTITINYLILAILETHECDGYAVISKIMMSSTIEEFKEFVTGLIAADCKLDIASESGPEFSADYDRMAEAIAAGGKTVTSALLFNEIVKNAGEVTKKLQALGVNVEEVNDVVIAYGSIRHGEMKPARRAKRKSVHKTADKREPAIRSRVIPEENNSVELNCANLVRNASNGMYDNLVGFDDVIDDIFDILGKYDRNTVAVVGPNGVGKTSIVQRLAKRIYDQDCPAMFGNKYVMEFNDVITNTVISEMNSKGKYIAYIDDLERMFLSKDNEAANIYILTELFKSTNISTIVCMTDSMYAKHIESRPGLARYMHKIVVDEMTDEPLSKAVMSSGRRIAEYNSVSIGPDIVNECIRLARRFIAIEKSPKAALNILDTASAHVRVSAKDSDELANLKSRLQKVKTEKMSIPNSAGAEEFDHMDRLIREEIAINGEISRLQLSTDDKPVELTVNDVRHAVSKMTGIPVTEMDADERSKLRNLYGNLTSKVIGQDDAVNEICKAVKRQRIGLSNPEKPCVMMFVGATGCGKSLLAKRLAHEMFGDEKNMVRLDMSEYSDKTSVTKLYGASAGYIGYDEGGVLTEAIRKRPRCVLLLDEIEKAHDDVYNVFLQVFDEGRLTDNKGNAVDFRNVIIIMTSNVGAKNVSEKAGHIGFGNHDDRQDDIDIIRKAIKKEFKPEFINRIDNICFFNRLTDENLETIIRNEIRNVQKKLTAIGYSLDDSVLDGRLVDSIFEKVKEESEYGARPVLREIQHQLEDRLTDCIIDGTVEPGHVFKLDDIYK